MKILLSAVAVSCFLFACREEAQTPEAFCIDGTVRWRGEPAADGLGWIIDKDDSTPGQPYIPQNLSGDFKINGLKVAVCLYQTDEKFYCFCARPLNTYRITSIQRR